MANSAIDPLFQVVMPAPSAAESARTASGEAAPFDDHLGRATEVSVPNDPPRHDGLAARQEDSAAVGDRLNSGNQSASSDHLAVEDNTNVGANSQPDDVQDEDANEPGDAVDISEEPDPLDQDESTAVAPVVQLQVVEQPIDNELATDESIPDATGEVEEDLQQSSSSAETKAEVAETVDLAETAAAAELAVPAETTEATLPTTSAEKLEAETVEPHALPQSHAESAEEQVEAVPAETEPNAIRSGVSAQENAQPTPGPGDDNPTANREQPIDSTNRQTEEAAPPDNYVNAHVEVAKDTNETELAVIENEDEAANSDGRKSARRPTRELRNSNSSNSGATNAVPTPVDAGEENLAPAIKIDPADATAAAVSKASAELPSDNSSAVATAGRTLDRIMTAVSVQPASTAPESARIPTADRARFVQRVGSALRLASHRDGQVLLRLSPPELGSLRLEISVKHGALTAKLETETSAARNILLDNLHSLRDRLAEQHIRIEKFDIDVTRDGGQQPENPTPRDTKDHRSQSGPTSRVVREKVSSDTTERSSQPLVDSANSIDDRLDVVI